MDQLHVHFDTSIKINPNNNDDDNSITCYIFYLKYYLVSIRQFSFLHKSADRILWKKKEINKKERGGGSLVIMDQCKISFK